MTEGEVYALRACEKHVESEVGRLKAAWKSETLARVFDRGINRTVTGESRLAHFHWEEAAIIASM